MPIDVQDLRLGYNPRLALFKQINPGTIKSLHIPGIESQKSLIRIVNLLSTSQLESLSIGNNHMSERMVQYLSTAISTSLLVSLSIDFCNMSRESLLSLISSLPPSIKNLNLKNNQLEDASALELSKIICRLNSLDISICHFGSLGPSILPMP